MAFASANAVFVCRVRGSRLAAARFGEGRVDELEEAAAIYDFNERRGVGGVGNDPDGGSVFDADALAEVPVVFDLLREVPMGSMAKGSATP